MDATAQVGEVLDGLQASFCFGSKGGQRRCQQVTESFFIAPPHTSAHLVQVTEAEVLRLVDDNGIGIGYVDATFDDGSGKQHVVIVIDEIKDYLLQFGRLHLSVSDTDTAVGNVPLYHGLQLKQIGNTVIHEEYLPVTAHLEIDGVGNDFLVEGVHFRLDGIAVRRRCLDDAQVARTHQRKLQGTGNGCSRHGQRIHIHLQLAKFLLDGDAELLLLINNQQTKVFELNVFSQDTVGTDKNIHFPFGKPFHYSLCLSSGAGTTQILHPARQAFQSLLEGLEMLIGKYGSGHQYSHLLIVRHSLESGTNSHLRLAEAHVTAHQAVHRTGTLHVGLHVGSSLTLVGGILIDEGGFQLPLQEAVGTVLETLLLAALRVEFYQVAGNILYLRLGAVFQLLPGSGAELVEAGRFTLLSLVLGNLVQRVDGDKHHIFVLIDNLHHLLRGVTVGDTYQSGKTPHTVVGMHHIVAGGELVQLLQAQGHLAAACLVALQVILVKAVEQLMVGKDADTQSVVGKAFVQRPFHGGKGYVVSTVLKDGTDAVSLFQAVAAYVDGVVTGEVFAETLCHHVEVFMEDRLYRSMERDGSIRRSGGLVTELHPAEIEGAQGELATINQLAFQRDGSILLRLTGGDGLWGERFVVHGLDAFA